jgi:hypothetical protein
MDYNTINALGNAIDNVYNYTAERGDRKTIAKIVNNNELHVSYRTILNIGKDSDLTMQMSLLVKESKDMIASRLRTIKTEFKSASGETLQTKVIGETDNCETLTVSPYSPFRKLKFSYTKKFEIT